MTFPTALVPSIGASRGVRERTVRSTRAAAAAVELGLFVVKSTPPAGYLNVDLEIEAAIPLSALAEELGRAVVVLYCGPAGARRHLLCLETSRYVRTAEAASRALCSAIERLTGRGRRLWDGARKKTFDVGYELPTGVRAVHVALSLETLERMAALGASVAFTCYRDRDSDPAGAPNKGQPVRKRRNRASVAGGSRR